MTGFGRERTVSDGKEYLVEIRSVNSRYCELTAKVPRNYTYLEEKLKTLVKSRLSRGKAEVSLTVYDIQGRDTAVTVNTPVVKRYLEEMRKCSRELGLKDDIELSDVFRMTDAFTVVRPEEDEDRIWANVEAAAKGALDKFAAMRETEGEKLKSDILEKLANIEKMTGEIEKLSPETNKAYCERLYTRLKEVLENAQIDEQRILTEAAIFADKTAVDEETVRLRSHFKQFREMTEAKEPVGRKLDFLVQELNRESNTIGSKCQDLRITKLVIEMKSEIEKIREQIQNIE
ncbi:MAG TPA: YicC family protein [Ruminococcaceae bacterium]|nr:YicC family protein [Oscillospiraceae bacterium]